MIGIFVLVFQCIKHSIMDYSWALVKDKEVAEKMTKFIELNTIGVSKDSQQRAAKVLQVISDSYEHVGNPKKGSPFFHFSHSLMEERWNALRSAVKQSGLFSLPDFPSGFCNFLGQPFRSQPGKTTLGLLRNMKQFHILVLLGRPFSMVRAQPCRYCQFEFRHLCFKSSLLR